MSPRRVSLRSSFRKEINRKIDLFKVDAVTLSADPKSSEFIIHVVDEHDYRYESKTYCEVIAATIRKIVKAKGSGIKFYRVVRPYCFT